MNFQSLVDLFKVTQEELQGQAARSIDLHLVVRNWLFGWYIIEFEQNGSDRAEYGTRLFQELSMCLKELEIKGSSPTRLKQYRTFYRTYMQIRQTLSAESANLIKSNTLQIRQTLSVESLGLQFRSASDDLALEKKLFPELASCFKLSWSHYVTLLSIENNEERNFYEIEAVENNWSVRELRRQMDSSLYERLALSRDKDKVKELSKKGHMIDSAVDIIKNPYVLEFLNLPEHPSYSENDLEAAIIGKLENFLLELGKGFLFEARQKRFTFDEDHFFVDLVFYNRLLRCYVLIDLKRDKLTHQDLGQMQMYVNYFDRFVKTEEEAPTVGIVLCHRKHDALVELTLPENSNIYAAKYQLYLPNKEELKQQIRIAEEEFEERNRS